MNRLCYNLFVSLIISTPWSFPEVLSISLSNLFNPFSTLNPVSQPRYPLRVNVGFLVNQQIGTSRDIHFQFPELQLSDLELSDFDGVARFSRTTQGILVTGNFTAKLNAECVRCLTDFQQALRMDFSELYAFKYKGVSESGLTVPEDGNLDLSPVVREYLLLEMPISPLCKPDCKGLCTICGADLNIEPCDHQKPVIRAEDRWPEDPSLA